MFRSITKLSFSKSLIPNKIQNKLFINGQFVNSSGNKAFQTINPADESVITDVHQANAQDVEKAVQAARYAFDHGPWRRMNTRERSKLIYRLADLIENNLEELAALESIDNGKHFTIARDVDMNLVHQTLRYYGGCVDKIHGEVIPIPGPYLQYSRKEPVGVCAQIIPWNFPAVMLAWKLGPVLATGCTTIIKPAEQTPLTALRIGELIKEAGFPDGVVNILPGYGDVGSALAKHPLVDKVAFTGSTEVGYKIMRESHVSNLKRITLELGGKSPNIIMDDADLDLAVQQAQVGLFFNAGQCCIAGSRIYVHEKIHDKFVEKALASAKNIKLGSQFQEGVGQGPQIDKEQMDKILNYCDIGQKQGAKLLTGGKREGKQGFFVKPTIFTDVREDMAIAKEEIFGPVMSIMKFSSIDEVIERANNNQYGLGAGLVTKSLDNAFKLINSLRVGTVYVNCYDVFTETMSFGGYKDSGIGREVGQHSLNNYLEIKNVIIKQTDDTLP